MLTTFVVNTLADGVGGEADGLVSLREAITAANSNAAFGDAVAGETDGDIIRFDPSVFGEEEAPTIALTEGEFEITDDLRIQGGEIGVTINARNLSRIFNINSSEQVTFGGLTLTGGNADRGGAVLSTGGGQTVFSQTTFESNTATEEGGAVYVDGGEFYAVDSVLDSNTANGASARGGAIFQASGTVGIFNGTLRTNIASVSGGAIEVVDGDFYSSNSNYGSLEIGGNLAGSGGGLHVSGIATTVISGGSFIQNIASRDGGGLWNQAGSRLFLHDVFIGQNEALGNEADNGGGGIFNNGGLVSINGGTISQNDAPGTSGSGGGIFSTDGLINLENVDVSANVATRAGGGIEIIDGVANIQNSTLQLNVAGTSGIVGDGTGNPGNGGGLHVSGNSATVLIGNTQILNNDAASEGGGLWNQAGSFLRVNNETVIEGNRATGDAADQGGGGIFNNGGRISVINSEITSNIALGASGSGGGILSTDGSVFVLNGTIASNQASRAGGGIEVIDGQVNLVDSTLGSAEFGGGNIAGPGDFAAPGNGGGLHVTGTETQVFLSQTLVGFNSAGSEGGGLWNQEGSLLRVDDSTITGNIARGAEADEGGGGIYNNGGNVTILGSSISENEAQGDAGSGGGVFSTDGRLLFFDTTIAFNVARAGGGIEMVNGFAQLENSPVRSNAANTQLFQTPGDGGGIRISGNESTLVLNDSAVAFNSATNQGGGIWNQAGSSVTVNRTDTSFASIFSNTAQDGHGGGIYNRGFLRANDASIQFNTTATLDGGGLFNTRTGVAEIAGSAVIGNNAARTGGGIANFGELSLLDSLFNSNTAAAVGGAIFTDADAVTIDFDSLFVDNIPQEQEQDDLFVI